MSFSRNRDISYTTEFRPGGRSSIEAPGIVIVVLTVGAAESALSKISTDFLRGDLRRRKRDCENLLAHMYRQSFEFTIVCPVLLGGIGAP